MPRNPPPSDIKTNHLLFDDCRVYDIEKRIKTPSKYLFPSFETTHWYAAKHVLDTIKGQSTRYSKHAYCEHAYNLRHL